jgi:predicted nucleic acid-binding protein
MNTLVDSSIWIDYFRGNGPTEIVDLLIEENNIFTNDLILAELLPALQVRREKRLISLLRQIKQHPVEIDWQDIIAMQFTCMRNGINGVGIPDLIVAQNAIQNGLYLLTSDKHFELLSRYLPLAIHE